jgi:hypothetical protein
LPRHRPIVTGEALDIAENFSILGTNAISRLKYLEALRINT